MFIWTKIVLFFLDFKNIYRFIKDILKKLSEIF